jgi:hypothetical protein
MNQTEPPSQPPKWEPHEAQVDSDDLYDLYPGIESLEELRLKFERENLYNLYPAIESFEPLSLESEDVTAARHRPKFL